MFTNLWSGASISCHHLWVLGSRTASSNAVWRRLLISEEEEEVLQWYDIDKRISGVAGLAYLDENTFQIFFCILMFVMKLWPMYNSI